MNNRQEIDGFSFKEGWRVMDDDEIKRIDASAPKYNPKTGMLTFYEHGDKFEITKKELFEKRKSDLMDQEEAFIASQALKIAIQAHTKSVITLIIVIVNVLIQVAIACYILFI